jgi:hypothetical protein
MKFTVPAPVGVIAPPVPKVKVRFPCKAIYFPYPSPASAIVPV